MNCSDMILDSVSVVNLDKVNLSNMIVSRESISQSSHPCFRELCAEPTDGQTDTQSDPLGSFTEPKRTRAGCVNIVLSVSDAGCKMSALAGAGACCQGCRVSRGSPGSPAASDERAVLAGLLGSKL